MLVNYGRAFYKDFQKPVLNNSRAGTCRRMFDGFGKETGSVTYLEGGRIGVAKYRFEFFFFFFYKTSNVLFNIDSA